MEKHSQEEECIICLDNNILNHASPVNILHIDNINKTCNCEYVIHHKCLYDWLNKKKTCIICNKEIIMPNNQNIFIDQHNISNNSQIVIQNIPPPPYILYSSNIHEYSSDTNSETSSYYSQDLHDQLNNVSEHNSFRICLFVLIATMVGICILLGN